MDTDPFGAPGPRIAPMQQSTPTPDPTGLVQVVAVAGRGVVASDTLVVTADDLGLTRGDGCFDATRVVTAPDGTSVVEHLDEHLERLDRSVQGLGDAADDAALWRELVAEAVAAWTVPGEAVLKLMYTRDGETVHGAPTRLLTVTPFGDDGIAQRDGLSVVRLPRGTASDAYAGAPWLLGGVKSLSYAVNKASLREAAARGAVDVLFTSSDGFLLEGPTSAVLLWTDEGLVSTPTGGTGILDSITLRTTFAAADAAGVPTTYRLIGADEPFTARGCWLLSSIRGVATVTTLDGRQLPVDDGLTGQVRGWAGF